MLFFKHEKTSNASPAFLARSRTRAYLFIRWLRSLPSLFPGASVTTRLDSIRDVTACPMSLPSLLPETSCNSSETARAAPAVNMYEWSSLPYNSSFFPPGPYRIASATGLVSMVNSSHLVRVYDCRIRWCTITTRTHSFVSILSIIDILCTWSE